MTAKEFIKSKQNGVLLNDYTLQEMEWFMSEFAKQKQNNMTPKEKIELIERLDEIGNAPQWVIEAIKDF